MKKLILTLLLLLSSNLMAAQGSIYKKIINEPYDDYFPKLKKAIEANHMNIVSEIDLMSRFKEAGYQKKFGADFNKNKLEKVTSLVICNGYVANQISNIDIEMMAFCPVRISVIQRGGKTIVLFIKASGIATNKKAASLLKSLDDVIVHTIDLSVDKYMEKSFAPSSFQGKHED
ncbi:DUF302 domain-containing protein [Sulfurimonas sp.]|uniref:DUF302 domain-containing protein n=1 Tax=Sulfurimonas sp. TaxID=2022749 RepID=UPI0025E1FEA5|nr:DUF302 domain-containing protein [Sulfurimonas sp.]MDD5157970.1 DUF302 domain-containing protein [Sulfurimonas sp.]